MTALALLAALAAAGRPPAVDGTDLVFDGPPPPPLEPYLAVLHTGVRAALTGRPWYGYDARTGRPGGPFPARAGGPLGFGALDPGRPVPAGVDTVCVAGDATWDRIPAAARAAVPAAFAPAIAPRPPAG